MKYLGTNEVEAVTIFLKLNIQKKRRVRNIHSLISYIYWKLQN